MVKNREAVQINEVLVPNNGTEHHLVLIAKNDNGFKNLLNMVAPESSKAK